MEAQKNPTPQRPYVCKVCGQTFKHRSSMPVHMRKHTGERPYKCAKCGKDFIYLSSYSIHLLSAHKSSGETSGVGRYRCQVCYRSFTSPLALKCHMRYHDDGPTHDENNAQKVSSPKTSKPEQNVISRPDLLTFKCMYCTERFRKREAMLLHERAHAQLYNGVLCKDCGKSFKSNLHLKYHITTCKHIHMCPHCGKKYHHHYKLDMHMRLSHGAGIDKPKGDIEAVTCKICGNQYRNRTNLKLHLRTHTGERPYKCSTCHMAFRQRHHLKGHRHVHEKTPDKLFECKDCKAYFKQEYNLKQHMMRLHPEKYDEFIKKLEATNFALEDVDENNEATVGGGGDTTEEIPQEHFCDICGLSFPKRHDLMKHIEKHVRYPDEIAKSNLENKNENGSSHKTPTPTAWTTSGFNTCKQLLMNRQVVNKKILEKFYVPRNNLFPFKRDIKTGKTLFACKVCKVTFTLKENMVRHIVRRAYDHGVYLKKRPQSLSHPSIPPNKLKDPNFMNYNHKCDVCGFAYSRKYNMLIHRKEHTDEEFRKAGVTPDRYDHIDEESAVVVAGDKDMTKDISSNSVNEHTRITEVSGEDNQECQVYVDRDEMDTGQSLQTDAAGPAEASSERAETDAGDSNAASEVSVTEADIQADTFADASVSAEPLQIRNDVDRSKSDNSEHSGRQQALSTSTSEKANSACPLCKLPFLEKQRTIKCHVCSFDYCIECSKMSRDVLDYLEKEADGAVGIVWVCEVCCPLLPRLGGLLSQLGEFEFAVKNKLTDLEKKLSVMEKDRSNTA